MPDNETAIVRAPYASSTCTQAVGWMNSREGGGRLGRGRPNGSELQDFAVGGDPNTIPHAVLLDVFQQVLAAQRHVVDRVHVDGDDGGVRCGLVRAQDIVLAHDDRPDVAKHASFAGVQEDHVRLELGQATRPDISPMAQSKFAVLTRRASR